MFDTQDFFSSDESRPVDNGDTSGMMFEHNEVTNLPKGIASMDLSQIRKKLSLPQPEGQGWDEDQIDIAILWYRRFLFAVCSQDDFTPVPNGPIDQVWHAHILDTRKYAVDCVTINGSMIHHYPYLGLNGPADEAKRDALFDRTNEFYMKNFGADCTAMAPTFVSRLKGAGCNDSGSGTGCGQRCGGGSKQGSAMTGTSCNDGGSGTGCGQGCGGGNK